MRCADCNRRADSYMVHDALWSRVGVGDGVLCLECLESRLGRPLGVDDLKLCGATVQHPRARRMITALLRQYPRRNR